MGVRARVVASLLALGCAGSCSLLFDDSSLKGGTKISDAGSLPDVTSDGSGGNVSIDGSSWDAPGDPTCDPDEKPGDGVFVSPNGADTGSGSKALPLQTISAGLELARSSGKTTLYLDQGSYAESPIITVEDTGITVQGGWTRTGSVWDRDCDPDAPGKTLIASPKNIGVRFESGTNATLETLSIVTKAVGKSGESMYGVVADPGAKVSLDHVQVVAGDAGFGGSATPGTAPTPSTCDPISECGDGSLGPDGSSGANATPGTFAASGYVPGAGKSGADGGAGNNGTPGSPGPSLSCDLSCIPFGGCLPAGSTIYTGNMGQCGCGGAGGPHGGGGPGGGGSIGIFAYGAGTAILLTASRAVSAKGGDGSPGASGANGDPGTLGQAGVTKSCPKCNASAGCIPLGIPLPGGAAGGPGGDGGKGGPGGDGAGGPSYSVVTGAGALFTQKDSLLEFGPPGVGAGQAPSGGAAKTFDAP